MGFLIRFFVLTAALGLTGVALPGIDFDSISALLLAALVIGLMNALLRPLLIFFTLPLVLVSLGLFLVVINAGLLLLASKFVPGFHVDGFLWAVLASIFVSILSFFLNRMVGGKSPKER